MCSTGGYPLGAENDPNAPYNQKENPEVGVTVCVSVTMHKTFKIKVKDYNIVDEYADEDGNYCCERDFSTCNLYDAVLNQCDVHHITDGTWTEDEFEVVLDSE